MSKEKTQAEAAAQTQAAADKKGKKYLVTFSHTFEDSEGIYKPNSEGKMQYTGHDKQIRTTTQHNRVVDSLEKAEALKAKFPNAQIQEYKGKQKAGELE